MIKEKICAYCHKALNKKDSYNINHDETSFICQVCLDTLTCENVFTNVLSWYRKPELFSFMFKVDKKHFYGVSIKQVSIKEWKMKYPGRR